MKKITFHRFAKYDLLTLNPEPRTENRTTEIASIYLRYRRYEVDDSLRDRRSTRRAVGRRYDSSRSIDLHESSTPRSRRPKGRGQVVDLRTGVVFKVGLYRISLCSAVIVNGALVVST